VAAEAPEARGDVRLAQLWNLLENVIQEVAVAAVEQGFLCNINELQGKQDLVLL
jgi:hypothetical protein